MLITSALWHFAQGVAMSSDKSRRAYAATGKVEDAASESWALQASLQALGKDKAAQIVKV